MKYKLNIRFRFKDVDNQKIKMMIHDLSLEEKFEKLGDELHQLLMHHDNFEIVGLLGAIKSPLIIDVNLDLDERINKNENK